MAKNQTMVALIFGQSNFANHGRPKAACPEGTFVLDGLDLVPAVDPLPGATGTMGSIWTRFGPLCLQDGQWGKVILVNVAVGGSLVKSWAPNGENHGRLIDVVERCRTAKLRITHVLFHQGESDTAQDTPRDSYFSDLNDVVKNLREQDVNAPMIICQASYFRGRVGQSVRQAQQDVVAQNPMLFQGPDSDLLTNKYRYDNLHFNKHGLLKMAEQLCETVKIVDAEVLNAQS